MRLPVLDKIKREDIPDAPDWIDPLLYSMNRTFEFFYRALDNQLGVNDNLNGEIKTVTLTQNDIDIGYRLRTGVVPRVVILGELVDKEVGSHVPITEGTNVDWTYQDGLITIHDIAGLGATNKHTVTLLILGE